MVQAHDHTLGESVRVVRFKFKKEHGTSEERELIQRWEEICSCIPWRGDERPLDKEVIDRVVEDVEILMELLKNSKLPTYFPAEKIQPMVTDVIQSLVGYIWIEDIQDVDLVNHALKLAEVATKLDLISRYCIHPPMYEKVGKWSTWKLGHHITKITQPEGTEFVELLDGFFSKSPAVIQKNEAIRAEYYNKNIQKMRHFGVTMNDFLLYVEAYNQCWICS